MANKILKIDITGEHGSGKLYLAEKIKAMLEEQSISVPTVIYSKDFKPNGNPETAEVVINVIHGDANG